MYKKIRKQNNFIFLIIPTILAYIGTEGFQFLYKKVCCENYKFLLIYFNYKLPVIIKKKHFIYFSFSKTNLYLF